MIKRKNPKLEALVGQAINAHQSGEINNAVSTYKKVLRKLPTHPDALHYLGIAQHQLGNSESAIKYIERAIAISPNYPDALNNLGNIFKETGALEKAHEMYTKVLTLSPKHADTLVNIAIVLRELKQYIEALARIQLALKINPEHAQGHFNLAKIHDELSQSELALASYKKAMQLDPSNHEAVKNAAKILHDTGRLSDALTILNLHLKQQPTNPIAQHMVASFGGADAPSRANDEYVKQVFDTFSASFDNSLARLQYKVPELITDCMVNTLRPGNTKNSQDETEERNAKVDVLDIGCGTGLCGSLIKAYSKLLVGIDLSPKMLEKAQTRAVYDQLQEAELTQYMQESEQQFDYIICADTFVYFGQVIDAFRAAFTCLNPAGYLIFTVERHAEQEREYDLQLHGRYSHSVSYLQEALTESGFIVEQIEEIVPRIENGTPVDGALILARKPS